MSRRLLISLLILSITLYAEQRRVISYNVYFHNSDENNRRIIHHLNNHDYDIIALQEVTPALRQMLLNDPRLARYSFYGEDPNKPYSNLTLTKEPADHHEVISYFSRMHRQAVSTTIYDVSIINVHLESMPEDTDIRIRQLRSIIDQNHGNLLILGDFNFGRQEEENRLLNQDLTNYTKELTGVSYDIQHNPLAARNAFENEKSRLLDQVWGDKIIISEIRILPLPYSDHYPLTFFLHTK